MQLMAQDVPLPVVPTTMKCFPNNSSTIRQAGTSRSWNSVPTSIVVVFGCTYTQASSSRVTKQAGSPRLGEFETPLLKYGAPLCSSRKISPASVSSTRRTSPSSTELDGKGELIAAMTPTTEEIGVTTLTSMPMSIRFPSRVLAGKSRTATACDPETDTTCPNRTSASEGTERF